MMSKETNYYNKLYITVFPTNASKVQMRHSFLPLIDMTKTDEKDL